MVASDVRVQGRVRVAGYWGATILIASAFLSGGVVYLAGAEIPVRGIVELGYPGYFVTLLGGWKVLGGLVLLAPGLPRVKEWAYAGIAFDLIAAAFSYAALGRALVKVIVPLVLLAITVVSWQFRPPSRMLA
jgi:hypothetical protein